MSRWASIQMARIRWANSNLNSHLFQRNLSNSELYDTCSKAETPYRFFIECVKYDNLRRDIVKYVPLDYLNINAILYGTLRYSKTLNIEVDL